MLRRSLWVLLAPSLVLAGCTKIEEGDTATALPEIAAPELSVETMKSITEELSSDAYEGRAPGTAGEAKATKLISEKFAAAGLEPGNNGGWFQDVPLVGITAKNTSPLKISGGKSDLSFQYGSDYVVASYQEQPKIEVADSDMVFVGYGINAPERGWNDYAGVDVKGKTVVILVNDPDFGTESLEGEFGGRAMTYYGRWTYKYEEAARQGAAGSLIVHQTAPASYGWNVVESSWTGPQAYAQRGENAPPLTKMNGWLTEDAARKVLTAAGQDLDVLTRAAQAKGFKAVPLGLTAATRFASDFRSIISHNIIGILPGREARQEYVMHTAHWDHLGRCTPAPDGDDICNGAVDNATGTAALVALAEAHAKAGPARRSLVFLAVTAEESGLLGAKYYAENPIFPLAQTVGGINMDAFQVAGPAKDVTVVGPGKSQLDQFLDAALKADGRIATPNPKPEAGYYYRSDHFAFAKQGVPMLYIDGGEDLIVGGKEAGAAVAADYTENRYHGPKDEFNEAWDWSGVMADLQLYYRIGRTLSMSTSWPNWNEGDEFKAVRDESCAASAMGC